MSLIIREDTPLLFYYIMDNTKEISEALKWWLTIGTITQQYLWKRYYPNVARLTGEQILDIHIKST